MHQTGQPRMNLKQCQWNSSLTKLLKTINCRQFQAVPCKGRARPPCHPLSNQFESQIIVLLYNAGWHLAIPGRTCRCPRGQCRSPHKPLPARGEAPCVRSHASLQQHPGQWEQDQHHKPHQRCWCYCFQLCPARLGKLQVHGTRWCQGWRQAERKGPRPPLPCWWCFETWSAAVLIKYASLFEPNATRTRHLILIQAPQQYASPLFSLFIHAMDGRPAHDSLSVNHAFIAYMTRLDTCTSSLPVLTAKHDNSTSLLVAPKTPTVEKHLSVLWEPTRLISLAESKQCRGSIWLPCSPYAAKCHKYPAASSARKRNCLFCSCGARRPNVILKNLG